MTEGPEESRISPPVLPLAMAGSNMWIFRGLALLLIFEGTRLSAFNLDHESVLRKDGDPGSYFGFSMAMHRQLRPTEERMLLVGAPKAKALSGQKAMTPGGLYSCDFRSPATTCKRVALDDGEDLRRESKENQWLGVTVNSQGPGGQVVTCAHRYQLRSNVNTGVESRDILGRCYVLSESLQLEVDDSWRFCEGRTRGHERFGSCQQGLSATFDKDWHYLIFGAPGAYNWKGVVRLEQRNNSLPNSWDDGPFETGDESKMDANLVPVPPTSYLGALFMASVSDSGGDEQFVYESGPPGAAAEGHLPPDSYLGFSLDSGMALVEQNRLTVVAGAPRANHSGAVLLMKKGDETTRSLLAEFTLEGEGLASSFGYDLTVLDLNQDGWEDIVVGAPQYFEKDGKIGGAVYVYVNKGGAWKTVTPTRIDGLENSMFGLAVENLGDINQDQYPDFAVGAPYDDDGAGMVYIYHGSPQGISSKKASQVLTGKPLNTKQFGYSLAGNMDLDMNNYPDLAVGSLSDSVFVYRARPVVDIKKEVTIEPKELDLTKKNCGNNICLTVEVCLSYTASAANYNPQLSVRYTLAVEEERRKKGLPSRVTFSSGGSGNSGMEGTMVLDRQQQKKCLNWKLVLQDNIRDKLHGIPITLSVELPDGKRNRRQASGGGLRPVLDANKPTSVMSEVSFLKEGCGADNLCQSNLMVKHRFGSWEPKQEKFEPLPTEGNVAVVTLSDQEEIALEITVSNTKGDDAYEASVDALFPNALTYSAYRTASNTHVTCTANNNGSQVRCELGNPFKRDAKVVIYIILSTSGISLNTRELEIDLQLETTSDQKKMDHVKAKAKVEIELLLSLSGQAQPSQLYYSGEVKGESAMKTESDIGSAIKYQFRIINLGKPLTNFGSASLVINWPKETTSGNWLLYLMEITSMGVKKVNCSSEKEVNFLGVKKEPSSNRRRRAVDDGAKTEGTIALLADKRKSETLSCGNGAACVVFHCPLQGLDSNAAVMFNARLWNGTFIEAFSELNYLDIIVNASLRVVSAGQNVVLKNSVSQVKVTVFPEKHAFKYAGGSYWWIILVAILLGLLLLALLIFLLWKCGFFNRTKHEDTVPSYNAVRVRKEARGAARDRPENRDNAPWTTSRKDHRHYS